jgi:hypothetical protein
VRHQLGALADQVGAAAQQVARLAPAFGVGVGQRERAAAQQAGDLAGVDVVVVGLAAVDGFPVQRVAEHEVDVLLVAEVGEPVPGEHALDADESRTKRRHGAQKSFGAAGEVLVADDVALVVEDAQVHGPGVQIDAAVESMPAGVEAHGKLSGWVGA